MFQLRDQVRQQRLMNLTRGFLSFYDCMVKLEDVRALVEHVAQCARKGIFLRHLTFEFCRFHEDDGTLEALKDFFHQTTSIESISMVKNHLNNTNIARMLDGAHNKELIVILPGGNDAFLHRDLILTACQNKVEKLFLDFKGSMNYAELDSGMVASLSRMRRLQVLRLDGWTMTDSVFADLVKGIRRNATLKSLHLGRIRGLTTASMSKIVTLGSYESSSNENSSSTQQKSTSHPQHEQQQRHCGLEELHISMIPSLFALLSAQPNEHRPENGPRQQQEHQQNEPITVPAAPSTVETFEEYFQTMTIQHVSIQESRLNHDIVRAIFRGLANQRPVPETKQHYPLFPNEQQPQSYTRHSAGISVFSLKSWSFSEAEFKELLSCLPKMRLSKLDLSQGGIDFSSHPLAIINALRPNLSLRELDLSYRGHTLNASTHATLGALLKRNSNLRMVQNVLEFHPSGRMDVLDKLAISRLMEEVDHENQQQKQQTAQKEKPNEKHALDALSTGQDQQQAEGQDQQQAEKEKSNENHGVAALDALFLLLKHRILETDIA